jgi:hypothetical protein
MPLLLKIKLWFSAICAHENAISARLFVSFHIICLFEPHLLDGEFTDARLEVEISPMYSKLKEGGVPSSHLVDKMHHWNTLVYVGTLILKVRLLLVHHTVEPFFFQVNKFSQTLLTEVMLDSAQLEASTQSTLVLNQLTNALVCHSPPVSQPVQKNSSEAIFSSLSLHANVQLTNFNAFMTAQEQGTSFIQVNAMCLFMCNASVCAMLRVDGVNINHRPDESVWDIGGVKVLHITHLPAVSSVM